MRYYSPTTNSFFDDAIHGARKLLVPDEDRLAKLIEALAFEADMEGEESDAQAQIELLLYRPPTIAVDNPDCRLPADAIEVSVAEYDEIFALLADGHELAPEPGTGRPIARPRVVSLEERMEMIRRRRDRDLRATDWTQAPDALTAAKRKAWAAHRQLLRDLPKLIEKAGRNADLVPYPEPPA